MTLTPAQLETLADRLLAASAADLSFLDAESLTEFDGPGRSLRRRQRGSRVVGGGRPGSGQAVRPLAADETEAPADEEQEDELELELAASSDAEQAGDDLRELLDDFSALLDTHRLATRDRCTPRMAQLAAARQRIAMALHGDLFGFDDFHSLHRALYSLPPARRDRTPRRGGGQQSGQAAPLWGAEP